MNCSHTTYGGGGGGDSGGNWASDVMQEDDYVGTEDELFNMRSNTDFLNANNQGYTFDDLFTHSNALDSFNPAFDQPCFFPHGSGPETLPQFHAGGQKLESVANVNTAAFLKRATQPRAAGTRKNKEKDVAKTKFNASPGASTATKQKLSAWGLDTRGCSDLHDVDDVDVVSCNSCPGSCPSQCGLEGQASICCDDDSCGASDVCLDEACKEATHPCTDTSCIRDGSAAASGTGQRDEVVAAAALTSLVDPSTTGGLGGNDQLSNFSHGYSHHGHQQSPFGMDLCCMPLGDSSSFNGLSMDSSASMQCQHGSHDPCWQHNDSFLLLNHIMEFHDPAHASQHIRPCPADNPNLWLSKCSLPSNDNIDFNVDVNQDAFFKCGFPVDNPVNFAQHVFTEHRSLVSGISPHASCFFNFQNQGQFMEDLQGNHDFSMAQNQSLYHSPNSSLQPGSASADYSNWSPSASPRTNVSIANTPQPSPISPLTPTPLTDQKPNEISLLRDAIVTPSSESQATSALIDDVYRCCWKDSDSGEICNESFTNSDDLDKHCRDNHVKMAKKTKDGYKCMWQPCKRTECFPQRGKLNRHLQTHTGFKPMECSICKLKLSAKQSLDQHMRTHTNETPYECAYGCGQRFKQHSALTMHHRTHSGEKPLTCEICGAKFRESSNLTKHRRTHMAKGMHECSICKKDFHRLDQLRRHLSSNHKDEPELVAMAVAKATSGRRDTRQYNRAIIIKNNSSTPSAGLEDSSPEPGYPGIVNDFMSDMIVGGELR